MLRDVIEMHFRLRFDKSHYTEDTHANERVVVNFNG